MSTGVALAVMLLGGACFVSTLMVLLARGRRKPLLVAVMLLGLGVFVTGLAFWAPGMARSYQNGTVARFESTFGVKVPEGEWSRVPQVPGDGVRKLTLTVGGVRKSCVTQVVGDADSLLLWCDGLAVPPRGR